MVNMDDIIRYKVIKPNYNNCILNVIASIKKHYGLDPLYNTNKDIDEILDNNNFKHIAIMVLDGMGSYIIRHNLKEDSFINSNKLKDMSAVYPPTTACAIPAICSGLEPGITGWCGWSNYFAEIDRQVIMFRNKDYFSSEKLDFDCLKAIPYNKFFSNLPVKTFEFEPKEIDPNGSKNFRVLLKRYLNMINVEKESFSYMYWFDPDATMHLNGSYGTHSRNTLKQIDRDLSAFYKKMPNDTLIICTADHGHIDVKPIFIREFTDLTETFERDPSNEGRTTFFKIKEDKKDEFKNLFNYHFDEYFMLLTKEEFINGGYLGPNIDKINPRYDSFIGDYVSIATDKYYFDYEYNYKDKKHLVFKSHHAGMTANEMMVPLVIIKN